MHWKKLNKEQYELITKKYDFYVCKNGNGWALDIFDHNTLSNTKSYVESLNVDGLRKGKLEAENYI